MVDTSSTASEATQRRSELPLTTDELQSTPQRINHVSSAHAYLAFLLPFAFAEAGPDAATAAVVDAVTTGAGTATAVAEPPAAAAAATALGVAVAAVCAGGVDTFFGLFCNNRRMRSISRSGGREET